MAWTPANITAECSSNPASCQPAVLAFMAFLVQHFNHSNDEYFTDSKINSQNVHKESKDEFDFIIIGGGSAGCVLASRLSEIKQWKILLLEAGDEEPAVADVPAFNKFLAGSSADWNYKTEPQSNACLSSKGRRCSYPSGKVMGGSSTTNSMYYSRGNKYDYENWNDMFGNIYEWSYDKVLKYFKKSEDNRDEDILAGDPKRHSIGGYLTVQRFPFVDKNLQTLIDAWKELGYKQIDYNSEQQVGFNRAQFTIINGARQSSNGAFLRPIRGKRSNLIIKTNSPVTKILIDPVTKIATGVEYSSFKNKKIVKRAYAKKEVILSAGVLNSPKLLMLSGIGKASQLATFDIEIMKELQVGDNFQDHVNVNPFTVVFTNTSTLVNISQLQNDIAYWISTHEGRLATLGSPSDITGYIQTSYEKNPGVPDILVVTQSKILEDADQIPANFSAVPYPRSYYNAMDIKVKLLNVKSRGTVTLNDKDPIWGPPLIQPNYFSNSTDLKTIVEGAFMVQKCLKTKAFDKAGIIQYKKSPINCKHLKFESPEYLECLAVNYTEPGLHGVGTCKMGLESDHSSVVNPKFWVHGVRHLRVIDASIMPVIPRGNTNAPTIMLAEKGSDLIKKRYFPDYKSFDKD